MDLIESEIRYDLLTQRATRWRLVRSYEEKLDAVEEAQRLIAEDLAESVRVDLVHILPSHRFQSRVISYQLPLEEMVDKEHMPIEGVVSSARMCARLDQVFNDPSRAMIGDLLYPYLRTACLTPIELMHNEAHLRHLSEQGTMRQSAIQRAAVALAHTTSMPVAQRIRHMNQLASDLYALITDTERLPPLSVAPGGLGDTIARARQDTDDELLMRMRVFRAIARHLEGTKTFAGKLRGLEELCTTDPNVEELVFIDTLVAEIFQLDLLGLPQDASRMAVMQRILSLHQGVDPRVPDGEPSDTPLIMGRIAIGLFPRARYALHERLRVEMRRAEPFVPGSDTVRELQAVQILLSEVENGPGMLSGDEFLLYAIKHKASMAISADYLERLLAPLDSGIDRARKLMELAPLVPGRDNKTRLADHMRLILSPTVLMRGLPDRGNRMAWFPTFAKIGLELERLDVDEALRKELVALIDNVLVEIVRNDLLRGPRIPGKWTADLIRLAIGSPIPPGEAKELLRQQLVLASRHKENFAAAIRKFPERSRGMVLERLKNLLASRKTEV